MRALDLPTEILAAEDPTRTMPRRLGLSDVVGQQIRLFQGQVKRRERITDDRARDLFRLVLRRPDSEEIFFQAGQRLAEHVEPNRILRRLYPRRVLFSLARRQIRRRLVFLFGRGIGAFAPGAFRLEAKGHFFLDMDPGGDACALLSGLAGSILSRYLGQDVAVTHSSCEARKNELCRWTVPDSTS
jgi:hypothetical protein